MEIFYRNCLIEVERAEGKPERFGAVLSTETACERYFGLEVLDHGQNSVDLSRVRAGGMPLLWSHNHQEPPMGRVENIRLESRKLRGDLVPSRSQKSADVWNDVRAGIIRDISVGYTVDEKSMKKEDGGIVRVMRWRPIEFSLCSVGLDVNSGVGRADNQNQNQRKDHKTMENEIVEVRERELFRMKEIRAMGKTFKLEKESEMAVERGTPVDEFRQLVMKALAERERPTESFASRTESPMRYDGSYPFRSLGELVQVARFVPGDSRLTAVRALSSGVGSAGGYAIPQAWVAGLLKNMEIRSTILADISKLVMEAQTVHYPKFALRDSAAGQLYGMSVYWGAEGAPMTDSGPHYAELLFTAQKLYGLVYVTNETLKDSVGAFETSLHMAIIDNLKNELERCIFRGNGVASPKGIIGSDICTSCPPSTVTVGPRPRRGSSSGQPLHAVLS